jgi:predicted Rossmann-fold nucleotide-binding protein
MAQGEACRDGLGEAAELLAHTLPERFQRLETGAAPGHMQADVRGAVVVDGGSI